MVICVTPPPLTEFCGSKINMKLEVCTDSIGCIGVMDVQCLTITCCWYDFICWIHRSLQRVEDVRHLGGMWSNHQRGVACFGVRRGGFHVRRCLIPNKSWANLFIRETLGWDWDRFLVFGELPQKTQKMTNCDLGGWVGAYSCYHPLEGKDLLFTESSFLVVKKLKTLIQGVLK